MINWNVVNDQSIVFWIEVGLRINEISTKRVRNMRMLEINDPLVLEFRGNHLYYTSGKYVIYFPGDDFVHPIKSGTLWEVSVKRIEKGGTIIHVVVSDYQSRYGIQSFQSDIGNALDKISFLELDTTTLLRQFDRSGASAKRPASSGGNFGRTESTQPTPNYEKPKPYTPIPPKVEKFGITIQAEIQDLNFLEEEVHYETDVTGAKGKVNLVIHDEAIQEAFGTIKPYICKSLKKKAIKVIAEVEIGIDRIGRCISAQSPELAVFFRRDIEEIRTDLIFEQFFESASEAQGFVEVDALTAIVQDLGGEELNPKSLLQKLDKKKSAKHFLELNYLAERHLSTEMKLHFLKEAMSFLFLVEGERRFHLVMEVYDKTFATYIWHFEKDPRSMELAIKAVKDDAGMLSQGHRKAYKSSQKGAEFRAIQHVYEGDRTRNFENWRRLFDAACD